MLEQKGREWGDAFANHDWAAMHATGPEEFKDKCPLDDFAVFFPIVNAYSTPSIPKGATFVIESTKIEGDLGWVYSYFEFGGQQLTWDVDQYAIDERTKQFGERIPIPGIGL